MCDISVYQHSLRCMDWSLDQFIRSNYTWGFKLQNVCNMCSSTIIVHAIIVCLGIRPVKIAALGLLTWMLSIWTILSESGKWNISLQIESTLKGGSKLQQHPVPSLPWHNAKEPPSSNHVCLLMNGRKSSGKWREASLAIAGKRHFSFRCIHNVLFQQIACQVSFNIIKLS